MPILRNSLSSVWDFSADVIKFTRWLLALVFCFISGTFYLNRKLIFAAGKSLNCWVWQCAAWRFPLLALERAAAHVTRQWEGRNVLRPLMRAPPNEIIIVHETVSPCMCVVPCVSWYRSVGWKIILTHTWHWEVALNHISGKKLHFVSFDHTISVSNRRIKICYFRVEIKRACRFESAVAQSVSRGPRTNIGLAPPSVIFAVVPKCGWAKCCYWCMRRKRGVLKRRISLRRTLLDMGLKSTGRPRPKERSMHDTNIVITSPSNSSSIRPFVSSWDLSEDDATFPPKVLSFQADYARRNSISLPCSPNNLHPSSVSIQRLFLGIARNRRKYFSFDPDVLFILFLWAL